MLSDLALAILDEANMVPWGPTDFPASSTRFGPEAPQQISYPEAHPLYPERDVIG